MPAPEHLRRCSCGQLCKSRSGLSTHARSCLTEQARSLAFTGAIERGLSRPALDMATRIAIRLGRAAAASAADERPTPQKLADAALRAASRRPCLLCPKAAGDSDYCAEHDDAPTPERTSL